MSTATAKKPDVTADRRSIDFTHRTLVFDCLSLLYILEDEYAERALSGGVNACNVTFGAETDWEGMTQTIESGLEKIEKSPNLRLATRADDILKAKDEGKLAVIMGTQGSVMVEKHLYRIELMYRLGLRYFGLAYTGATLLADGCGELRDAGITFLGKEAIEIVNRLGMILDLSHCGHRTRAEAVELARAPVCTHSNSYSVNPNDRNTKDETAKAIAAKGGALGICGLPMSVWPKNQTIEHMLDHCDHYNKLVGHRHIGIGLDFTEGYKAEGRILPESRRWRTNRPDVFGTVDEFLTQSYPAGLSSIVQVPNFTHGLFKRGYSEEQVAAILGGNWFRNFKEKVG